MSDRMGGAQYDNERLEAWSDEITLGPTPATFAQGVERCMGYASALLDSVRPDRSCKPFHVQKMAQELARVRWAAPEGSSVNENVSDSVRP